MHGPKEGDLRHLRDMGGESSKVGNLGSPGRVVTGAGEDCTFSGAAVIRSGGSGWVSAAGGSLW